MAFLLFGSIAGGMAYWLWYQKEEAKKQKATPPPADKAAAASTESVDSVTPPDMLELHVGYGLVPLVDTAQGGGTLGTGEEGFAGKRRKILDLSFLQSTSETICS